jgi:hypothetical protein
LKAVTGSNGGSGANGGVGTSGQIVVEWIE